MRRGHLPQQPACNPVYVDEQVTLFLGDALVLLREMPAHSIDALATDPPAGIGFMGVAWDSYSEAKGGSRSEADWDWTGSKERLRTADAQQRVIAKQGRAFRAFLAAVMAECLRVLKPGAHAFVWAIPRTSHWTATAIEDAGFEIRDVVTHHFGSGFPKSLDVAKAIDRAAGAEREDKFEGAIKRRAGPTGNRRCGECGKWLVSSNPCRCPRPQDVAQTEAAHEWEGWGTALKPASEHWILARKPLSEPTVAANVLKHGTGALNIDGGRIEGPAWDAHDATGLAKKKFFTDGEALVIRKEPHGGGRWPTNLILSHSIQCEPYSCAPNCPVAEMDRQSGNRPAGGALTGKEPSTPATNVYGEYERLDWTSYADAGGASRFFYIPKASRSEREQGVESGVRLADPYGEHRGRRMDDKSRIDGKPAKRARNHHPTVKPVGLMRYLCRLITPPGGVVLDPFAGSGTTCLAAKEEGFRAIGIDLDAEYLGIATQRLRQATLWGVIA